MASDIPTFLAARARRFKYREERRERVMRILRSTMEEISKQKTRGSAGRCYFAPMSKQTSSNSATSITHQPPRDSDSVPASLVEPVNAPETISNDMDTLEDTRDSITTQPCGSPPSLDLEPCEMDSILDGSLLQPSNPLLSITPRIGPVGTTSDNETPATINSSGDPIATNAYENPDSITTVLCSPSVSPSNISVDGTGDQRRDSLDLPSPTCSPDPKAIANMDYTDEGIVVNICTTTPSSGPSTHGCEDSDSDCIIVEEMIRRPNVSTAFESHVRLRNNAVKGRSNPVRASIQRRVRPRRRGGSRCRPEFVTVRKEMFKTLENMQSMLQKAIERLSS